MPFKVCFLCTVQIKCTLIQNLNTQSSSDNLKCAELISHKLRKLDGLKVEVKSKKEFRNTYVHIHLYLHAYNNTNDPNNSPIHFIHYIKLISLFLLRNRCKYVHASTHNTDFFSVHLTYVWRHISRVSQRLTWWFIWPYKAFYFFEHW